MPVSPADAWGIALRAIAVIYFLALWSLHRELLALCGSRGITPVGASLARMRRDMGIVTCVLRHPSLLWISCRDGVLVWLARAGMVFAALGAAGIASRPMLAATWIAYLSFDVALGMTYPWESLLFEAGFLAILLPPLEPLPSLRMSASPDPLLMWLFQWLLFRVMFGFGKNKFTKAALGDPLYLRSFIVSQPMVSPLGWRAWRLPRPLLVGSQGLLFVVEMILPFFVFFAGWPRLAAAAGFCGLMAGIQAMGNFGFFNLLVISLSVTLLDPRSISFASIRATATSSHWPIAAVAVWVVAASLFHLPFNTWVARGWLEWPAWGGLPRFWQGVLAVLRAAMPWRTVHAYGVFPPRIGPPVKWIPVIEGTQDGEHWEVYEYRYQPSTPASPPRFVAPHTPRLDHSLIYDAAGANHTNLLATIFSLGSPYTFAPTTPCDRLLQRLLEPRGPVHDLFRRVPFGDTPPVRVRVRLVSLTPASPAELASTGRYWHVDVIGEHAPERGADPTVWDRTVPAPEQFHPDERWARRRVPRLSPLLRASSLADVKGTLDEEAQRRWDEFWDAVVPRLRIACDAGWEAVDRLARDLRAQYGSPTMDAFDRVRGAVATALLERLEPRVLTRGPSRIEPRSYFHVSLWAHAMIVGDAARIAVVLGDPFTVTTADVTGPEVESRGLMVLTALRRDLMALHARKHRLMLRLQMATGPSSPAIPGFHLAMPALAEALPDPDERLPQLVMTADGNWTYDGTRVLDRRFTARR